MDRTHFEKTPLKIWQLNSKYGQLHRKGFDLARIRHEFN